MLKRVFLKHKFFIYKSTDNIKLFNESHKEEVIQEYYTYLKKSQ